MPKRTDIKSILILGAGPIVIGQACEFDYSGAQACKALREEGYRVILVNSNPATIMTDPEMADATYIEPIHWEVVRKIIEKERPDAVLPTMGGQTALNCALELEQGSWTLTGGLPEAKKEDELPFHVVAYDFGAKRNILRMLVDRGCRLTIVPAQTSAEDVLKMNPDGIFLSNGPGDPAPCDYAITAIQKFLETDIPVFGICLGHQLPARRRVDQGWLQGDPGS